MAGTTEWKRVVLERDREHGFGFSIVGGDLLEDHSGLTPIVVSKLRPKGPASNPLHGLCVGDHIASINGNAVDNVTHFRAVWLLQQSTSTCTLELYPEGLLAEGGDVAHADPQQSTDAESPREEADSGSIPATPAVDGPVEVSAAKEGMYDILPPPAHLHLQVAYEQVVVRHGFAPTEEGELAVAPGDIVKVHGFRIVACQERHQVLKTHPSVRSQAPSSTPHP